MIDIDLTEAVEEAARDRYEATEHMTCWPSLAEASKRVWRSDVEGAVFAASSIIAKQVAEQIAAAIELTGRKAHASAIRRPCRTDAEYATDLADDFEWAAMVAREAVR